MKYINKTDHKLVITYVPISILVHPDYNPRVIDDSTKPPVHKSIKMHGMKDPLIVNSAKGRENIILSGNLRYEVCKDLGYDEVPVVYVNIPNLEQEKDLVVRLNKALGRWDEKLLAELGEEFLVDVGFSSEDIDSILDVEENHEEFDLKKELEKLDIKNIDIKPGNTFAIGDLLKVRCGDSMNESDVLALMDGELLRTSMTKSIKSIRTKYRCLKLKCLNTQKQITITKLLLLQCFS